MADSPGSSLANILWYIWALVLACFAGKTTSAQSELPLVACGGSPSAQVQQTLRRSEDKAHSKRDQFLRHPSLGSSRRKGRQKETRSKRYSIFSLGSSMQYFNPFVHQPRARSPTVPVVIVTPSSPTRTPVADLLPPSSSSPLGLTDPTAEPSEHYPTRSVLEETGEVLVASEKQISVPPDIENDISYVEFDSWTTSAPQEASEPSFFLSESLQKITFEPVRCASHAFSAVSDMLYDVPTWRALDVGMPSYFTSTPPRRRRSADTKLRDIENNYDEAIAPLEPPSYEDAFYQHVDPVPYPDVFDLDMYYDTTIPSEKKPYSRDCAFENALSLQSDGLTDPPICEKLASDDCKEKYDGVYHEPKRDSKSCCDDISQSLSTRCLSKNTSSPTPPPLSLVISQHRIPPHSSSDHCHIKPLNESTNTFYRTSSTTSPSSTLYSIEKSAAAYVKSQHEILSLPDQRSRSSHCHVQTGTSSDMAPESDASSMDALHARLREACDSPSKLTFTEKIEIWEPVSF